MDGLAAARGARTDRRAKAEALDAAIRSSSVTTNWLLARGLPIVWKAEAVTPLYLLAPSASQRTNPWKQDSLLAAGPRKTRGASSR